MKIIQQLLILTASFNIISCNILTTQQRILLNRAENIKAYPVSRNVMIKTMGLEDLESQRSGGRVRSGSMWFVEHWNHPSGLKLKAYDSEHKGKLVISREDIDNFLNKRIAHPILITNTQKPRKSFENLEILSSHGKVLYSQLSNPNRSRR